MSECRPCGVLECDLEEDYTYQVDVASPAAAVGTAPDCRPCGVIDCGALTDYQTYALQSDLYNVVAPAIAFNPGADLRLRCCDGSDIVRTVTQGMTASQFSSLLSGMVAECKLRDPDCGNTPTNGNGGGGGDDGGGSGEPIRLYAGHATNCTYRCPDGTPFVFTLPAGSALGFSQAAADAAADQYACQLAVIHRLCLNGRFPDARCLSTVGSLTVRITATASSNPGNQWAITGSLPTGLTWAIQPVHRTYIEVTGTLTAAGSFTFTIRFQNPLGIWVNKSYTVRILDISPGTIPDPINGVAYSQQMTLTGAIHPVTWEISSGTLPPGLSLGALTGRITGVPAMTGFSTFTIKATETPPI